MGWKIARMVVAKSIYNLARIWRCFNANCTNDQMGRIKGIKAKNSRYSPIRGIRVKNFLTLLQP
jgi:hypothetical protein